MWYLKEEVYFEPLFNHWYAWPYLLVPTTGSRYVVNTHLRIMRSFIKNYKLHIMASKESVLAGGEFLACSEDQVEHIINLVDELEVTCSELIELSKAVETLEELLRHHTSGECIDYLYTKVPRALRGYVEIFLDMEHRASYRLIEPLIYRSKYYKPSLQSVSFGMLSRVGERPFILSTPRIADDDHLQVNLDYNSPVLKKLLSARDKRLTTEEVDRLFASVETTGGLPYQELFTDQLPERTHTPVTEGVRLQYTGHAGFLIETSEISILIDPVIANRSESNSDEIISFSELPPSIDYVCLTHNHQDHINFETLLQLRHKIKQVLVPKNNGGTLADPSIKLLLQQFEFAVTEIDDLQAIHIADGTINGIPFLGEHGDLNIRSKTAWYIEILGRKLFFGADSSNPDPYLYQHLGKIYRDIDVLAIGMECVGAPYTWLYGALHTKTVSKSIKKSRRLNGSDFEQAFPMVKAFNARQVCIYALGAEPWYKYFMGIEYDDNSKQMQESRKMIDACQQINVPAEAMYGKKTIYLSKVETENIA